MPPHTLKAVSAKAAAQQPSIAVLPFANMSRDADDEYFSDGLAEEILNALAHIPGTEGHRPHLVLRLRGKEQDIRKIARDAWRDERSWKAASAEPGAAFG